MQNLQRLSRDQVPRGLGLIPQRFQARGVDVLGTLLSMLAVGGVTFAIIEDPEVGWLHPQTLGVIAAAFGFMLGFVWWERRCSEPMIDIGLFKRRTFAGGSYGIGSLVGPVPSPGDSSDRL